MILCSLQSAEFPNGSKDSSFIIEHCEHFHIQNVKSGGSRDAIQSALDHTLDIKLNNLKYGLKATGAPQILYQF